MATVSLTNYASQVAEIERQKKLAELLQQQAQQPIEIQSYKGTQAPIPWSAVLAKVLGQVGGQIKEARAIKQAGELADLDRKTAAGLPEQMQHTVTMDNVRSLAGPQMQPTGMGGKLASLLSQGGQAPPVDPTAAPAMAPPAPAMAPPQAPIMQSNLPPVAPNAASPASLVQALGGTPSQAIAPAPKFQEMGQGFVPAQRDVTLDRALSPAEQQQMALKAMMSGGPMTEKMGNLLYTFAAAKQTKAEDRAGKIEDAQTALDMKRVDDARDEADMVKAIRNSGMPPELQDRYINALPVAGLAGVKEMVVADMKPKTRKSAYDEYLDAVDNGWTPPDPTNPDGFGQYQSVKQKGVLAGVVNFSPGGSAVRIGGPSSAPAAPGVFGAQIESKVAELIPGATITSGARTPEKNAAVNGVADSYHLSNNARDYSPPAGVSTAQMAATLKAKMPGYDVIDEGTHVHVEPGPGMAKPGDGGVTKLYQAPDRPKAAPSTSASQWALTPEEQAALNKAAGENRIDVTRLNSRTAKLQAQALLNNPNINLINNHAIAAMTSNPTFQTKAIISASLPEVLENVRDAGKKLNFSNISYIGKLQAWKNKTLNDPDFIQYMGQRNDALMTIANVMRATGATDKSIEMEMKSAPESMSPQAFDAWYEGQMKSLKPRLDRIAPFTVKPPGVASVAGGKVPRSNF